MPSSEIIASAKNPWGDETSPGTLRSETRKALFSKKIYLGERIMEKMVLVAGISSIALIFLIFIFLFKEAVNFFATANPLWLIGREVYDAWDDKTFFSTIWQPVSDVPKYSFLPLVCGSLLVSFPATVIAAVFGVGSAVYLSEIASSRVRETLKPILELLASIPSVVIGFFILWIAASFFQDLFNTQFRLNAFVSALGVALVTMPIIITISEDALRSVPKDLKQASYALGATRWQTIFGVTIPAAVSGIFSAIILGFGRALGETMVVVMATGNASIITANIFSSVRTMTATIATELGEVANGDEHYCVLFLLGAFLFIFTFILNLISEIILNRMRRKLRM